MLDVRHIHSFFPIIWCLLSLFFVGRRSSKMTSMFHSFTHTYFSFVRFLKWLDLLEEIRGQKNWHVWQDPCMQTFDTGCCEFQLAIIIIVCPHVHNTSKPKRRKEKGKTETIEDGIRRHWNKKMDEE